MLAADFDELFRVDSTWKIGQTS